MSARNSIRFSAHLGVAGFIAICLMAIVFFAARTRLAANELSLTATRVEKNGSSNCRRPHNAGVYAKGRTFICWPGAQMQPCVKMYDHKTGKWSDTQVVYKYTSADYHDYPVMVKGTDDYLNLFWSTHNGSLYYCRSPRPLEVQGEWTYKRLPATAATYPAPLADSAGNLYVFYRARGNNLVSYFDYVKSSDHGATWTVVRDAIASKSLGFYLMNTQYEPARGNTPERLQLTWFLNRNVTNENIYFAYFVPLGDRFMSADGTDLGPTITVDELDGKCMVTQLNRKDMPIHSTYQDDGSPVVIYKSGKVRVWAQWNGRGWEQHEIPFGIRDIEKIGPNAYRAYSGGAGQLFWFESTDGGKTWKQAGQLALPIKDISQCIVIDDFNPEIRLFIQQDDVWQPQTYDGTDLIFVAGENGMIPVK